MISLLLRESIKISLRKYKELSKMPQNTIWMVSQLPQLLNEKRLILRI